MPVPAPASLVVMGVAGCGKSTVAAAVSREMDGEWLEGDQFHGAANRRKMARGEPLTDGDRIDWLASLCGQLRQRPCLILACSALKLAYRDQLRDAAPGLRFAFLDITRAEARRRVHGRAGHFFAASLVDNQFDTLEPPTGEAGVLRLDGTRPVEALTAAVCDWLRATPPAP